MRASTSRFIYSLGLLAVTAWALLPETLPAPVAAVATASPQTTEVRLAKAIRDRIEQQATHDAAAPSLFEAVATEVALRELAFADDIVSTRHDLIAALASELSNAMGERSKLAARFGEAAPHLERADAVITGLTVAINSEVRRNRI